MQLSRISLFALIISCAVLFNSCSEEDGELTFPFTFTNVIVPASTFATAGGFNSEKTIYDETFENTLDDLLAASGSSLDDIKDVQLSGLTLNITGPADQDLDDFLYGIAYIGAPGLTDLAIGSTPTFVNGTTTVSFDTKFDNLKPYLTGENFTLRVDMYNENVIFNDVSFSATGDLRVVFSQD